MAMIADDPVRQLIGRKNGIAAIWMHRNLEAAADQLPPLLQDKERSGLAKSGQSAYANYADKMTNTDMAYSRALMLKHRPKALLC